MEQEWDEICNVIPVKAESASFMALDGKSEAEIKSIKQKIMQNRLERDENDKKNDDEHEPGIQMFEGKK